MPFIRHSSSLCKADQGRRLFVAFTIRKKLIRVISSRLPEIMIEELKLIANKRDVPYQSLMKIFLAERVEQELHK